MGLRLSPDRSGRHERFRAAGFTTEEIPSAGRRLLTKFKNIPASVALAVTEAIVPSASVDDPELNEAGNIVVRRKGRGHLGKEEILTVSRKAPNAQQIISDFMNFNDEN